MLNTEKSKIRTNMIAKSFQLNYYITFKLLYISAEGF